MSPAARTRFYFPAWHKAMNACWRVERGVVRAVPHRDEAVGEGLPTASAVEAMARATATAENRAVSADDLRHACHVIALGKDMSTEVMDNRQTDRVVTCFRILADPLDLDAVMEWTHPTNAERKRLLWAIEHSELSFEYRQAVCRDKFGQPDWHALELAELRQFAMTCRARARGGRARPIHTAQ